MRLSPKVVVHKLAARLHLNNFCAAVNVVEKYLCKSFVVASINSKQKTRVGRKFVPAQLELLCDCLPKIRSCGKQQEIGRME